MLLCARDLSQFPMHRYRGLHRWGVEIARTEPLSSEKCIIEELKHEFIWIHSLIQKNTHFFRDLAKEASKYVTFGGFGLLFKVLLQ